MVSTPHEFREVRLEQATIRALLSLVPFLRGLSQALDSLSVRAGVGADEVLAMLDRAVIVASSSEFVGAIASPAVRVQRRSWLNVVNDCSEQGGRRPVRNRCHKASPVLATDPSKNPLPRQDALGVVLSLGEDTFVDFDDFAWATDSLNWATPQVFQPSSRSHQVIEVCSVAQPCRKRRATCNGSRLPSTSPCYRARACHSSLRVT